MKHTNKFWGTMLLAVAVFTSCADMDSLEFAYEKPASVEGMEYLANYGALKEYKTNSNVSPDFKLGVALAAGDYNANGIVTRLANANFEEVVTGNEMKMASIVSDNGAMDFGTVDAFVTNAVENGLSVYGHTLAWHAQQPVKWLNSLIADREIEVDPDEKLEVDDKITDFSNYDKFPFYVMGYEPAIVDGVLVSYNPTEWHQYFVVDGIATTPGRDYTVTALMKATSDHSINVQLGNWGALQEAKISVSTEWVEQKVTISGVSTESSFVVFQSGVYDGEIQIKWVKVSHSEAPAVELYYDQVDNGAMEEGKSMANFIVREKGKGDVPGPILVGQGPDGMNCTKVTSVANPENTWDTQFFIVSNKTWEGGEKYKISFWYRATEDAGCETQCHGDPGAYMHWAMLPENPSFTTEWKYYEKIATIPGDGNGMKTIAFNLNVNQNVVTYYFTDIQWQSIEKGNKIPLTPEEKKDTLTWAMDQWVAGMMEACNGRVKAWDVVNEAISGGYPDGEGVFALQHGSEDNTTDFFWQDYLGDLDYVRTAVRLAREYGPEDIKLFVNDYNLESDWDQNGKLKSLIKWIERWEADGVTKIDGIGTQMHISCYADPNTQASKKAAIENMFRLMATSGKLVRVSELDMGYVDGEGNTVKTVDMTDEQHRQMAELYEFVIQKYLELIPKEQQWGITQWCITDSPADSGWRAGEPVGLWDLNFNRKHTYAGFADGLAGGK